MGELLLELLSEEIPARMQRRGVDELVRRLKDFLGNENLEPDDVKSYVTPRRLTVVATGIPDRQPDFFDERRGPRLGAPEAARSGFARSAGVAVTDLIERDGYYYAEVVRPGRPTREVLPNLVFEAIEETVWPKSMRFPAAPIHWVRPLNSIICLFDGQIIPLSLGQVPTGRVTRGHRFLSKGEIAVDNAADYLRKLEAAYVILDPARRRDSISADLDRLAATEGLTVKPDPGLLDEVAGLVEYPVVLMGAIDEASMALPPEVLATAMRTHQKYFTALKPDGSPAPRFLFVANNATPDGGRTIVAGNERVLRARLADARFFWDQDRKTPLANRVAALKERVYYEKLGTMRDKTERIEKLATFIAQHLVMPTQAGIQGDHVESAALDSRFRGNDGRESARLAQQAAHLCKADLSTGMVGEFPELQGVMGRYYALHDGEEPAVADAIAQHYKPQGPNDTCPTAPVSVVVALADKLDSLAAFFSIGEKPTGSRDPFALRRAALGTIRLVLENGLRLSLREAFREALGRLPETSTPSYRRRPVSTADMDPGLRRDDDVTRVGELLDFIADRLKVHLREEGTRHDLIAAVFALAEDDLVRLLARVAALAKFLDTENGANLLVAYRRAANIVAIEERKGGWTLGAVDPALLRQAEEQALARHLDAQSDAVSRSLRDEAFADAMSALARLRVPVDEFFDKVTVNTEDKPLRENRLRLLSRIRAVMNQVADFSQIEG